MRTDTLEERLSSPGTFQHGQLDTSTVLAQVDNATDFLFSAMTSPEAQGHPGGHPGGHLDPLAGAPLDTPNITVIDNTTYCWDESLNVYTWCQNDRLYSVPLSEFLEGLSLIDATFVRRGEKKADGNVYYYQRLFRAAAVPISGH